MLQAPVKANTIGKNDPATSEKPEKKEKKIKEMSESRVKKFHKLFGQQVSVEEKLINYFSCALVAEILLQGHLYVSENYFSFYSNVFGYITKIIIPVSTVESISKEKTAKLFPNAIALQLLDGGTHQFGSFLSREMAYQLMSAIHQRRSQLSLEPAQKTEETEADEVDGALAQDMEVSSLEDSSSISGSECQSPAHFLIADPTENDPEVIEERLHAEPPKYAKTHDPMGKVGKFNVKLMNEFNILFLGIGLTILLAFFSGLLLLKINAIESQSLPTSTLHDLNSHKMTIEDAESILNKNVLIVRNVREKLEELQNMLQSSFDKIPSALNEQHCKL